MIPPNRVDHILFIVFFILLVSAEAAPSILKCTPDHTEARRATCTPAMHLLMMFLQSRPPFLLAA